MYAILYSEFPFEHESKVFDEFPALKTKVLGCTDSIHKAQQLLSIYANRLMKLKGGYNKSKNAYISTISKEKMELGLSLYRKDANTIEIYERTIEMQPAYLWGNYTYENCRKYGYLEVVECQNVIKTVTYDDCIKELSEFLSTKYRPKTQKFCDVKKIKNNYIK